MACPSCHSPELKVIWSWARYTDNVLGYEDSVMDYQLFVSRSTRYRCLKCGTSFIHYSRKYNLSGEDKQERHLKVVEAAELAAARPKRSKKVNTSK